MIDRVHLFYTKDDRSLKIEASQVPLSCVERDRFESISSPIKKREYLFSRFILDKILREQFNADISIFEKDSNGRPFLKDSFGSISISHSKGHLLVGVCPTQFKVGVDIEAKQWNQNMMTIAKQHFAPDEVEQLKNTRNNEQMGITFRSLWSLKEAYFKVICTDKGIDVVKAVSCDLHKGTIKTLNLSYHLSPFSFWVYAEKEFSCGVCIQRNNIQEKLKIVDIFSNIEMEGIRLLSNLENKSVM